MLTPSDRKLSRGSVASTTRGSSSQVAPAPRHQGHAGSVVSHVEDEGDDDHVDLDTEEREMERGTGAEKRARMLARDKAGRDKVQGELFGDSPHECVPSHLGCPLPPPPSPTPSPFFRARSGSRRRKSSTWRGPKP
jgi:hypothetical protein